MTQGERIRAQITSAILEAAASVIAVHGDSMSMADVAAAAGVGRATLYRYFNSRECLIRALASAAIGDAEERLDAADLDNIPVPQALERATRALLTAGQHFSAVIEDRRFIDPAELHERIGRRILAIFARGVEDESLRSDLSADTLARLWGGMLDAMLRSPLIDEYGVERATSAVTETFLGGARRALSG